MIQQTKQKSFQIQCWLIEGIYLAKNYLFQKFERFSRTW